MSTILSYLGFGATAYLALTLVFYGLSLRVPVAGFVARLLASYAALILCASYGVIASIFMRLIGSGRSSQWATARSFKYVMWLTTGVTFTVEDPNDYLNKIRPAVFIGNHQTELDVLMLGCMFPKNCAVTAKKSLKNWPFLGWFMSLSGTVFIDRANSSSARHAMAGAAEEISRDKQSVYMFPEGTRSYAKEPTLLPFKKGAFHLAVQAGVPIVPVVVANYSNVLYLQEFKFNSGTIPMKGTLLHDSLMCVLICTSLEADRNKEPENIRRRRSGSRYERVDASRDGELNGKSARATSSDASTKAWGWCSKSEWCGSYDIITVEWSRRYRVDGRMAVLDLTPRDIVMQITNKRHICMFGVWDCLHQAVYTP
jgi:lysophosphatidate acyltransferase